jgi:hypothetical protein
VLEGLGLAAKSAGSGGAFVCMCSEAPWALGGDEEDAVRERLKDVGFEFVRILVPEEPEPAPEQGGGDMLAQRSETEREDHCEFSGGSN